MNSDRIGKSFSKGLILEHNAVSTGEDGSITIKMPHDGSLELRRGLLFWDRLVKVSNPIVYLDPSADEEFLVQTGVMKVVRGCCDPR